MSDTEIDTLKQKLRAMELAFEQEKGKRIAVERQNHEIQKAAKEATAQAEALKAETDNSLVEAAQQMSLHLAISQGIWAMGRLNRAYLIRKVAAARVVYRESMLIEHTESLIKAYKAGDQQTIKTLEEKLNLIATTIRGDGEASRVAAAEASLAYGVKEFEKTFDKLVADNNPILP